MATTGFYSNAAWTNWTITSTSDTSTSTGCANDTWTIWCKGGTSTVASTTAWTTWAGNVPVVNYAIDRRSNEEIAAETERLLKAEAEWQAKEKERLEKKEAADRRALLLLMAVLNEAQRKEYQTKKHFHVRSQSGRRYRVDHGSHGNLKLVDESGKVLKSLCVQPNYIPIGDVLAAQALHLIHNEEEIVRTSNITDAKTGRCVKGSMEALAA